ncbi:glycosyltransferase [Devosia geojensis]|uniref:glycosyltransferase n=1 Tax=Devosia geojensis TaxID=443610 RepID=UPI0009FF1A80|nr:glycosyltransferase [Devosia geojensis]
MVERNAGLVHVRTPTYKRPEALQRALSSLIAQSWENWVCDVYDDDPGQSGRIAVDALADPRIRYTHNVPQRFASKNIDQCFTADNPHDADYFCVVEDDNLVLPTFFEENIALCRDNDVEIVLRNQFIEHASGTDRAHLSEGGVLDHLFVEGLYSPEDFRQSLLIGIGVSNGGLFWSRDTSCRLEIRFACTATLQEYMRTFSVCEPIYVAMEPLAVWAENAEQTTRNAELKSSYVRRELDLKRSVQVLQRIVWSQLPRERRRAFLTNPLFAAPPAERARTLAKALVMPGLDGQLAGGEALRLRARGLAILTLGRLTPDFERFVQSRLEQISDTPGGPAPTREVVRA